jgi:hypothetical protein
MKNLLLFVLTSLFALNLFASTTDSYTGHCNSDFWFENIQHGKTYPKGSDVYVRVKARKHYDIAWMELYVNNRKIRRENHAPYEWAKPHTNGDYQLKNLRAGTYKLKCLVRTKCGHFYKKYITIYVKGHHNPHHCNKKAWFEYGKHGTKYKAGKDVYVRVKAQNSHDIEYMELYVNGRFVRRENHAAYEWGKPHSHGDHLLRNMRKGTYKLKCVVKTKCGHKYSYYSTIYVYNGYSS